MRERISITFHDYRITKLTVRAVSGNCATKRGILRDVAVGVEGRIIRYAISHNGQQAANAVCPLQCTGEINSPNVIGCVCGRIGSYCFGNDVIAIPVMSDTLDRCHPRTCHGLQPHAALMVVGERNNIHVVANKNEAIFPVPHVVPAVTHRSHVPIVVIRRQGRYRIGNSGILIEPIGDVESDLRVVRGNNAVADRIEDVAIRIGAHGRSRHL